MQARLPDINTAYIKYRNKAFDNIESGHYHLCISALYNLNALLAEPYRVKVSTKDYLEKIKQDIFFKCSKCKEETIKDQIRILNVMVPLLTNFISDKKSVQVWLCPNCSHENILQTTEISQEVLPNPVYFKVVPEPPQRKDGLMSRWTYHIKFTQWAENFLTELEAQMAQFRDDNWSKEDDIYTDHEIEIDESDYDS